MFCFFFFFFFLGKGWRYGFTGEEITVLEEVYERSGGHPGRLERKRLMEQFGFSKKKVYNWFYCRRARESRKK
jgi:hypothetical protein